jgi:hypothetical protein
VPENKLTQDVYDYIIKDDNYYYDNSRLIFVPENFRTRELCKIAFNNLDSELQYIPEKYRTEELYGIVFANENF